MSKSTRNTCVHLIATLSEGGNEVLAKSLIQHWPEPVHHVVVVLGHHDGPMASRFEEIAEVVRIPTGWPISLGGLRESFYFIRSVSPKSLVSYTFGLPALPLCWIARLQGVKRVVMRVGNPPPTHPRLRFKWRVITFLCRLARIPLVSCSQTVHCQMTSLARLPDYSTPLLNGCDSLDIAERAQAARNRRTDDDVKRLLMVARLDPIKDQTTLIKAFAATGVVGWQLQLVGEGPERCRLEALTRELGLDPCKVFLGRRSDIPEMLGRADLFAFSTTRDEGFGIVLVEAMAAGLPIISSDVPACREVLRDGAAGELVPRGDVGAWTERLQSLMNSVVEREKLAKMAVSHANAYDIRTTAMRWYQLLNTEPP